MTFFETVVKAAAESYGFEPLGETAGIERDDATAGYWVHLYDAVVDHHIKCYVSHRDVMLGRYDRAGFARAVYDLVARCRREVDYAVAGPPAGAGAEVSA